MWLSCRSPDEPAIGCNGDMMPLEFVPVTRALSKRAFDCGNENLNVYFKRYALKNHTSNISRTFVAELDGQMVGYLTVNAAQIHFNDIPDSFQKGLPRYPLPAYRICRLAVDKGFQGQGYGALLLREALFKALSISSGMGLFAVLVDAIDEVAVRFYQKFGFISFRDDPLTLFLPMKTIERSIR